jgi:hypothetical protein
MQEVHRGKRQVVAENRQVAGFAGFEVEIEVEVEEDRERHFAGFAGFAEFALVAGFPIQTVCGGDIGVLCKNKIHKLTC